MKKIEEYIEKIEDIDRQISELKSEKKRVHGEIVEKFAPHKVGQKARYIRETRVRKPGGTIFDHKYTTKVSEETLVCVGVQFWVHFKEFMYEFKRIKPDGKLTSNYIHGVNGKVEWLDEYYEGKIEP